MDVDRHKRLSNYSLASDGSLTRDTIAGTRKYGGYDDGRHSPPLEFVSVIKAATIKECNHQTGTYKHNISHLMLPTPLTVICPTAGLTKYPRPDRLLLYEPVGVHALAVSPPAIILFLLVAHIAERLYYGECLKSRLAWCVM
jgi:hypothetical protein